MPLSKWHWRWEIASISHAIQMKLIQQSLYGALSHSLLSNEPLWGLFQPSGNAPRSRPSLNHDAQHGRNTMQTAKKTKAPEHLETHARGYADSMHRKNGIDWKVASDVQQSTSQGMKHEDQWVRIIFMQLGFTTRPPGPAVVLFLLSAWTTKSRQWMWKMRPKEIQRFQYLRE